MTRAKLIFNSISTFTGPIFEIKVLLLHPTTTLIAGAGKTLSI